MFMSDEGIWYWIGFIAFVIVMLMLDLGVFHKKNVNYFSSDFIQHCARKLCSTWEKFQDLCHKQEWRNPRHQVYVDAKFCPVVPNYCSFFPSFSNMGISSHAPSRKRQITVRLKGHCKTAGAKYRTSCQPLVAPTYLENLLVPGQKTFCGVVLQCS